MKRGIRRLLAALCVVLAGAWGGVLGYFHLHGGLPIIERAEAALTDLRMVVRGPRPAPDLVTIVAIDDETVRREGGYPLSRASLARLVDAISGLGAKVIALDILLLDRGPEGGDGQLQAALARARAVLAAAAVFSQARQQLPASPDDPRAGIPLADDFLMPLDRFAAVAATGVVNVTIDHTGAPHFAPMLFAAGDRLEASFALRTASLALAKDPQFEAGELLLGGRRIRTDFGYALPLSFYGPRGSVATVSAARLLDGGLAPGAIAGRVVVIGATVAGGGDVFPTPFDPVLPGVEVVATAILHLLAGDGPVRDGAVRRLDVAVAVALPMLLVALLAWGRNLAAFAGIAAALALWAAANMAGFGRGIWLSAALPLAAAIPPAVLFGVAQIWIGRRSARFFASQSRLLQHIQAPGMSQWLARNPGFLSEPVRQDVAIVFVDLSGFTGCSEALGPAATRELLDEFYELVDREAGACGGIITSFMGDGMMVLFGLPEPSGADALAAARFTIRLADAVRGWVEASPLLGVPRIGFKIGAHFGVAVASRLGRGEHRQIAVTGDTVNVASRLMEVAAANRAEVAISDALYRAAGLPAALAGADRFSGPIRAGFRGRAGSLPVWLWPGRTASRD